jgi:hypothetical protein
MLFSIDGFGAGDAGLAGFLASAPGGAVGGFVWLFGVPAGFSACEFAGAVGAFWPTAVGVNAVASAASSTPRAACPDLQDLLVSERVRWRRMS